MIKATQIIEKPVVSQSDQALIGRVSNIIFDPKGQRLAGLLVKRGWWRRSRVLPIEEILAVTAERILTDNKKSLVKKKDRRYFELLAKPFELIGMVVQDGANNFAGRVREASFYLKDGTLAELEVAKDILSSLAGGRLILLADQITSVQPDFITVDLTKSAPPVRGGLAQAASELGVRLNKLKDEAVKLVSRREAQYILGKTAGRAVYDSEKKIVDVGEVITENHIEQAATAGRLHQLTLAAGIGDTKESWRRWTGSKETGEILDKRRLEK